MSLFLTHNKRLHSLFIRIRHFYDYIYNLFLVFGRNYSFLEVLEIRIISVSGYKTGSPNYRTLRLYQSQLSLYTCCSNYFFYKRKDEY